MNGDAAVVEWPLGNQIVILKFAPFNHIRNECKITSRMPPPHLNPAIVHVPVLNPPAGAPSGERSVVQSERLCAFGNQFQLPGSRKRDHAMPAPIDLTRDRAIGEWPSVIWNQGPPSRRRPRHTASSQLAPAAVLLATNRKARE